MPAFVDLDFLVTDGFVCSPALKTALYVHDIFLDTVFPTVQQLVFTGTINVMARVDRTGKEAAKTLNDAHSAYEGPSIITESETNTERMSSIT